MAISKANLRAVAKYTKNHYDDIKVRVDKGEREKIQAHAQSRGESTNVFIKRAITETMARDVEKEKDVSSDADDIKRC